MSWTRVAALMRVVGLPRVPTFFVGFFLLCTALGGAVGLAPLVETGTVAVDGAALMPALPGALEAKGFGIRDAAPGETSRPLTGTLVVRIESPGNDPGRRLVRLPGRDAMFLFPPTFRRRFEEAIRAVTSDWRDDRFREAGLSDERLRPVTFAYEDDIISDATRRSVTPAMDDVERVAFGMIPDRRLALVLGAAAGLAGTLSVLGLKTAASQGRLEGLLGSDARPAEVVTALVLLPGLVVTAMLSLAMPMSCLLLWFVFGVAPPWQALVVPPLGGLAASILAMTGIAGSTFARRPVLSSMLGGGAISVVIGLSNLPRLGAIAGIGEGWIHAVPFAGMVIGATGGNVTPFEAAASTAVTLALAATAYAVAVLRTHSGMYLRADI